MIRARFSMQCCVILTLIIAPATASADWNWAGWRGPKQDGHTTETGLPKKWDDESVTWKTPLKGIGQSSPVVWGEKIFLTEARNKGRERVVLCLNRNDGRVIWEKTAWTGDPEPIHRMNSWASATCATDGKHVYAFFGKGGGMFCYTVAGTLVWNTPLGEFVGPWGTAASPILVGDLVIQNCDADKDAYIVGLNKTTGKQVWKTKRDDARGWSSPILITAGDRQELVINGDTGVRSYNPKTGKEYWYCKSFTGRGSPTVAPSEAGLLHVVNGKPGDTYAIQPGGSGDVSSTHRKWRAKRKGGRDLPSPIASGDFLLISSMSGVFSCYDTKTGKTHWSERIGGKMSAAPIAYDGLVAFISEAGETYLIKPGTKATVVARNRLSGKRNELFRSSITPSDGQLFIRSTTTLYCIGKRKPAK